jgi:hypothetical protein
VVQTLNGKFEDMKRGFGDRDLESRATRYWISCYEKENEDEPISCHRAEITYKPGQSKQQKMLAYCYDIFRYSPSIWEVLVHQGPSEIPESGDQIVARLSRERFDDCAELTI